MRGGAGQRRTGDLLAGAAVTTGGDERRRQPAPMLVNRSRRGDRCQESKTSSPVASSRARGVQHDDPRLSRRNITDKPAPPAQGAHQVGGLPGPGREENTPAMPRPGPTPRGLLRCWPMLARSDKRDPDDLPRQRRASVDPQPGQVPDPAQFNAVSAACINRASLQRHADNSATRVRGRRSSRLYSGGDHLFPGSGAARGDRWAAGELGRE